MMQEMQKRLHQNQVRLHYIPYGFLHIHLFITLVKVLNSYFSLDA